MVTQFVAELKGVLSDPRLERYRQPAGARDLDMLINYYWNMAIADSLLCSLSVVEILLRNSIHNALSDFYGRADWYDGTGLLDDNQLKDVEKAKQHIIGRKRDVTPARIVSNLTFGFWVTILSGNYNDRFWRPARSLNLKTAFPHAPKKNKRNDIQAKYYAANNLRNRAFHHEPLFDQRSLLDDYRRTYEGIEWIDPSMVVKTKLVDRFPYVHASGKSEIEIMLRKHLGLPTRRVIAPSRVAVYRRRVRSV